MPPQLKRVVSEISDLVCLNCICLFEFQDGSVCNNPNSHVIRQNYLNDFCIEGMWRVEINHRQSSVLKFDLAYNHLTQE